MVSLTRGAKTLTQLQYSKPYGKDEGNLKEIIVPVVECYRLVPRSEHFPLCPLKLVDYLSEFYRTALAYPCIIGNTFYRLSQDENIPASSTGGTVSARSGLLIEDMSMVLSCYWGHHYLNMIVGQSQQGDKATRTVSP